MQKPPQKLVSVLITTYNASAFLAETLASLARQTYPNLEVVIVDDGSTDATPDIITAASATYPSLTIKPVFREHSGRIPALNHAIELAAGDYLAICDADDLFAPTKLTTQIAFLDTHPDVGFCGTDAQAIDEHSNSLSGITFVSAFSDTEIRHAIVGHNPFVHSSIIYRREALLEHATQPYSERFVPGFEWEVYSNIMKDWKTANLPEKLVSYRFHTNNITKKRSAWRRVINTARARWYVYRSLAPEYRHWPQLLSGIRDILPKRH